MKTTRTITTAVVLGAALVSGVVAWQGRADLEAPPEIPAQPATTPVALVQAHPFTLDVPAVHDWRAERPTYDHGTLLVLQTEPDALIARQGYEAVLYVGAETAHRVNVGDQSGNLIAIVPGDVDLATAPIFFGEPELPERVTAAEAARQLAAAEVLGVQPAGAARAAEVTHDPVHYVDAKELQVGASFLIEEFSPQETSLIEGIRVPRVDWE